MILGATRPAPFRPGVANAAIPGFVTGHGSPAHGKIVSSVDSKGRAKAAYRDVCSRCGGAGGSDKWDHTGWTCFDCSGTGEGPTREMTVYTPEAFARLEAIRAKRAAKAAAAAKAAEDERRSPYLAWEAANLHVLEQAQAHAPATLVDRLKHSCSRFVIPPEWLLGACVEAALRGLLRQDVKAASEHVGEVGKRAEITLTCEKVLDYSERGSNGYLFRAFYIALMRDEAGNRVVYKGGALPLGEGQTGRFKATVKEHGERDGEKQTVVARPLRLDAEEPLA